MVKCCLFFDEPETSQEETKELGEDVRRLRQVLRGDGLDDATRTRKDLELAKVQWDLAVVEYKLADPDNKEELRDLATQCYSIYQLWLARQGEAEVREAVQRLETRLEATTREQEATTRELVTVKEIGRRISRLESNHSAHA
mmetsp:Transcript_40019/g.93854  ORF Transcript_40019/g.93854 Transcript_40019/m.93854 type:complete len:142 (-) Transcript_40019:329-754(-)